MERDMIIDQKYEMAGTCVMIIQVMKRHAYKIGRTRYITTYVQLNNERGMWCNGIRR